MFTGEKRSRQVFSHDRTSFQRVMTNANLNQQITHMKRQTGIYVAITPKLPAADSICFEKPSAYATQPVH